MNMNMINLNKQNDNSTKTNSIISSLKVQKFNDDDTFKEIRTINNNKWNNNFEYDTNNTG